MHIGRKRGTKPALVPPADALQGGDVVRIQLTQCQLGVTKKSLLVGIAEAIKGLYWLLGSSVQKPARRDGF
jgi:hypothetical protein